MKNEVLDDMREMLSLSCKVLIEKLRSGEATAADIQAVRALLKDSGVNALPVSGSPIHDLQEAAAESLKFPFPAGGSLLPADDPAIKTGTA